MLASQILELTSPEELFPANLDLAKKKFHELAKEWHPDHNKSSAAANVFQHIHHLYDEAVNKLEHGFWDAKGMFVVRLKGGSSHEIPYRKKQSFELGSFYVGDDHVTYLVNPAHKDLYDNFIIRTKSFKYGSTRMREDVLKCLPILGSTFELVDGRLGLSLIKDKEMLQLRDVYNHYGDLDPKHVAWIMSTMHNLSCYLGYTQIAHNDISMDTYFVSPKDHVGALLGGWWYAASAGARLSQIPARTFNFLPWEVKNEKLALTLTDLELIRLTGRELLGSFSGYKLNESKAPEPMIAYLTSVASKSAVTTYEQWSEVLKASFGKRRFTEMDLNADTLYR